MMKKFIEVNETREEGFEPLMGQKVLLFCARYIYCGVLEEIHETCVILSGASIVFETGEFNSPTYQDEQKLHTDRWHVQRLAIESFGLSK